MLQHWQAYDNSRVSVQDLCYQQFCRLHPKLACLANTIHLKDLSRPDHVGGQFEKPIRGNECCDLDTPSYVSPYPELATRLAFALIGADAKNRSTGTASISILTSKRYFNIIGVLCVILVDTQILI